MPVLYFRRCFNSTLSEVENTHRCTPCRVKCAKKGADVQVLQGAECRFGYGTDGRSLSSQGYVKNGEVRVHADGSVEMDNVRIYIGEHADQQPGQMLEAEILRATRARKAAHQAGQHLKPTITILWSTSVVGQLTSTPPTIESSNSVYVPVWTSK